MVFCLKAVSVTSSGLLRVHGPINDRCLGCQRTVGQPCQPRVSKMSPATVDTIPGQSLPDLSSTTSLLGQCFQPLRRIPRGLRKAVGAKLQVILEDVVASNTVKAWERLLLFPWHCLYKPDRGGQRWLLASQVNRQIADEGYSLQVLNHSKNRSSLSNDPDKYLRSAISLKLGEGDFTRAVHLASSRDSLAAVSDATFSTLQAFCILPPSLSCI